MKLTLPQQDVYYEQLLYPDEPIYNIGAKVAISGPVDYKLLNQAFTALINQHDVCRSVLVRGEEGVTMELLPASCPTLEFADFSGEEDADGKANRYMQKMFGKTFHLNDKKLLNRFVLVKVNSSFHYLFAMYHHIITDGWGTSLLFREWVQNYNELFTHGAIGHREQYHYSDFAADDAQYYASSQYEEDRQYWKNRFRRLPESLLPRINENMIVNRSKRKELIVPRELYNQLEALAACLKCTTFHVILAVLYMYLGRKYRQKEITIGLPVLNRGKAAFKRTVGLFTGMSPLRMQLFFDKTFAELVADIKQQLRQDYRHQRFPLGKLVQELDAFKERERLFNITVSYENQNYADHLVNTRTSVMPLTHESERVALAVYIREFDKAEDVRIDFDYHVNYFEEAAATCMVNHFEQLLRGVCEAPGIALWKYKYLTAAEEVRLLYTFNETQFAYPENSTLIAFFNRQAKARAEQPAITDGTDTYTYGELDACSGRVALHLRTLLQTGENAPLAVLMPRSARLLPILLGVLKAGNAYIPLDPDFPPARLAYIVAHSKAACIIGTEEHRHTIDTDIRFICADSLMYGPEHPAGEGLPQISAAATAYIIYTSGSTGVPKGVEIGHRSLLNFLLSMQQRPGITEKDTLFSVTTQSFDISILEFFAPLIAGARIYLAPPHLQHDPQSMVATLEAEKPTIIQATPGFYQLLFDAGWKGSKHLRVLCGGDLLSVALAEKLLNSCAVVWNMYGPTETTIWSGIKQLCRPEDASNIGAPIHNTQFYLLDDYQQPLPVGCPGDIYIGGHGLAKGYYKNEVLTAERFIDHPFRTGEKIYRTGDIGAWNDLGELRFMGRSDYQVKVRGYRIELGEIEARLNQLAPVRSSVVVARKQEKQAALVAYIVPEEDDGVDTAALMAALKEQLPEYMIPCKIIPVREFPLTPNRKVDRGLLASLELEPVRGTATDTVPQTSLEVALCGLFKEALQYEDAIRTSDNFFSIGGDSINAMKVVNLVQQQLYYGISFKDIFNYPTVQALAKRLQQLDTIPPGRIAVTSVGPHYPVSSSQFSIWLAAHQSSRMAVAYNVFAVYAISGEPDVLKLEQSFITLIDKYEILRTNFRELEGMPRQQVRAAGDMQFGIDRISAEAPELGRMLEDYVNKQFDLENDLLLRVGLFRTGTANYLAFASHHVILDGWSVGVLIQELCKLYQAPAPQSAVLPFQFRDYVAWQRQLATARAPMNERFWQKYLDNYCWKPLIPEQPYPTGDEYIAAVHSFEWDEPFFSSLKASAANRQCTLHTLLLTAFLTLLHKQYGYNDLCIATVNAGRTIADLHNQVGMFVKSLPLRLRFQPKQSVATLLETVHIDLLETDAYQDIPEQIYNSLSPEVLFVLQPDTFRYDSVELGEGVHLTLYPLAARYSRLPLLINFSEGRNGLKCEVTYSTGKYSGSNIELLFLRYEQLLAQLVNQPDIAIEDLDTRLAFEKEPAIDIDFNF